MGLREWGKYFVVLVIALITGIPISSIYFVFYENLPPISYITFTIPVCMLWINYYLGITTQPGNVPVGYDPSIAYVPATKSDTLTSDRHLNTTMDNKEEESSQSNDHNDFEGPTLIHLKKSGKKWRWCRKCEVYKPPRTHHCMPLSIYCIYFGMNSRV